MGILHFPCTVFSVYSVVAENIDSILPQWKGLEIPEGCGVPKNQKKIKEMYEVELEFPEGWEGSNKKFLPRGRYWLITPLEHLPPPPPHPPPLPHLLPDEKYIENNCFPLKITKHS